MLRKKPSKKETSGPYVPKYLEKGKFPEVRIAPAQHQKAHPAYRTGAMGFD